MLSTTSIQSHIVFEQFSSPATIGFSQLSLLQIGKTHYGILQMTWSQTNSETVVKQIDKTINFLMTQLEQMPTAALNELSHPHLNDVNNLLSSGFPVCPPDRKR